MDDINIKDIQKAVDRLRGEAKKAQAVARDEIVPLFHRADRKPPGDFTESSYLYMRSCDADGGFRPLPCPVFWLSPDIRVVPLSNMGAPTRELIAGHAYRLAATVRNRGDLAVPAAKVEFYLVDPSLGFDIRFATFIGVAQGRVEAHGATEIAIDYVVPPALSGHHCLFARVFAFAPQDLPVSDYALDPPIDRHVAQLNLTIIGGGQSMMMQVVHLPNADDLIQIVPTRRADLLLMRHEIVTSMRAVSSRLAAEWAGQIELKLVPDKSGIADVQVKRAKGGVVMTSRSGKGESTEYQAKLTSSLLKHSAAAAEGQGDPRELQGLFAEYRKMTATALRAELHLSLPDLGLKPGQFAAFDIRRTNRVTGMVNGGVTMLVTAST